jgi:hypothetical protein
LVHLVFLRIPFVAADYLILNRHQRYVQECDDLVAFTKTEAATRQKHTFYNAPQILLLNLISIVDFLPNTCQIASLVLVSMFRVRE